MRSTHKSTSIWEIELRLLQMLALEMVLKTFHFVPGLSRTPLLFSSISHQHIFRKYFSKQKNLENLKIWNSENPGSLTGAQHTAVAAGKVNAPDNYK